MYHDAGDSGRAQPLLVEGEASCFYHAAKKAAVACEGCGRFLCALCDIEMAGRHICPSCVESEKKKGNTNRVTTHRVLYDEASLALAIVPMIFLWPTLVTAPITLFLVCRYWKAPLSIVPRTRIRFVVAGLIAAAQAAGWIVFFTFLATR